MKRKLIKFKVKLNKEEMVMEDILASFRSWRRNLKHTNSYFQSKRIDIFFNSIF